MAQQLSAATTAGTIVGQSASDLVGFFGTAGVVQQTAGTAPVSTAAVSVTATQWAYATSAQANAITACLIAVNTALTNLGLQA